MPSPDKSHNGFRNGPAAERGPAGSADGVDAGASHVGGAQAERPPSSVASGDEVSFGQVTCPRLIGDYEILRLLGSGGMGNVFVVKNQFFGREEALKMIHDRLDSREARKRFIDEMQTQARLDHANIAKIHYAGMYKHQGKYRHQLYFVMSLEKGDLGEAVERNGPMPPDVAANLVRRVAKAIAHAHARGVIHCDLKPKNILLGADGSPKVTDFGLVKLLANTRGGQPGEGRPFGTPSYMPPEQAEGAHDRVNQRSDVYGLGAVLYELLTGQPPFPGVSRDEILKQVKNPAVTPRPPRELNAKVPLRLEAICMRCLRKYPGQRYASAQEVANELRDFLRPPWWRRRWREVAITALCAVLGWVGWENLPSPRADAAREVDGADTERAKGDLDGAMHRLESARDAYRNLIEAPLVLDRSSLKRKVGGVEAQLVELRDKMGQQKEQDARRARLAGNRDRAIEKYRAAARDYDELARSGPSTDADDTLRPRRARILTALAELYEEQRNPAAVEEVLRAAESVLGDGKGEGASAEYLLRRAEIAHAWGIRYDNNEEPDRAREHYRQEIRFRKQLQESQPNDPEYRRALALSYGHLGDALVETGDFATAKQCYADAAALRKELAEGGQDAESHCLHARDFGNSARWHEWQGETARAIENRRERLAYYASHVKPFPALLPAAFVSERAAAAVDAAELALDMPAGSAEDIASLLDAARRELEELIKLDPHSPELLSVSARCHLCRGRYHQARGAGRAAVSELTAAIRNFEALEDQRKSQADDVYYNAVAHAVLGGSPDTAEYERLKQQMLAMHLLEIAARRKFNHLLRLDRDHGLEHLRRSYPAEFEKIRDVVRETLGHLRQSGPARRTEPS